MVAILHCIIIQIENEKIKRNLMYWQWQKNYSKNKKKINNDIKLFYYFRSVRVYIDQLTKIKNDKICWGRGY